MQSMPKTNLRHSLLAFVAVALLTVAALGRAQDKFIVVASTTSTEQSGLFSHPLPTFKKDKGIDVRVVAVGTGQALDMGRRGDADVVFVHDTAAEEKFVGEGFGVKRFSVMYNDFVLIGPKADPASVKGADITSALASSPHLRRASSRAATRAARTQPRCATGRQPTSTLPLPSPQGTRSVAAAWARR
jgi:tungstate transport system substrate-binding protein